MKQVVFYMVIWCTLFGCTSLPNHPVQSEEFPPIFPDYIGVTIPDGIAPLNFGYAGTEDVKVMDVVVSGSKGEPLHVNGKYADFDVEAWHTLLHQNVGDSLTLTVCVKTSAGWKQYRPFPVYISADALPEWGVTYRLVPPGYDTYGHMGIYQRNLSNFDENALVDNKRIDLNCVNCHTQNRSDESQFTFHVRGAHGATVVGHDGQVDILSSTNEELGGGMVYPYWHPSGEYIAYSTNDTHQNFHQLQGLRVEVYDLKSDILLYKPATQELICDSIVAQEDLLENYPTFSPDGKWLYFSSAQRVDSVWKNYQNIKYNICRIGFDVSTGRLGQQVETVVDARQQGKSANLPRISPDGRFLLYTLCDYGCFPIWHPEADQWLLDLESGEAHPLELANSDEADSFHNWSQSSRWIVFTSRRDDGLYTNLYFVHIDAQGVASKPFQLPQRRPQEYVAETIYSFNTPDFLRQEIHQDLYQQLMGEQRTPTKLRIVP